MGFGVNSYKYEVVGQGILRIEKDFVVSHLSRKVEFTSYRYANGVGDVADKDEEPVSWISDHETDTRFYDDSEILIDDEDETLRHTVKFEGDVARKYIITGSTNDESPEGANAEVYLYSGEFDKLWSAQYDGNFRYYLPDGHGSEKNSGEKFLLIGAKNDSGGVEMYSVAIEFDYSPNEQVVIDGILFGYAKVEMEETYTPKMPINVLNIYTVDHTNSENNNIILLSSDRMFNQGNVVVYGTDVNDNNTLETSEIDGYYDKSVHFVSKIKYDNSYVICKGIKEGIFDIFLHMGARHMDIFLEPDNYPVGYENSEFKVFSTTINVTDSRLEHRVGFDLSGNEESVNDHVEIRYKDGSNMENYILNTEALEYLIISTIYKSENIDEITNKYDNDPDPVEPHEFTFDIPDQNLEFKLFEDPAGQFAWGKCRVSGNMVMKIGYDENLGISFESNAVVDLNLTDLYDWDVTFDPHFAFLQAGFPHSGNHGKVFKIRCDVTGTVKMIQEEE